MPSVPSYWGMRLASFPVRPPPEVGVFGPDGRDREVSTALVRGPCERGGEFKVAAARKNLL